jgi:hypothetical protein
MEITAWGKRGKRGVGGIAWQEDVATGRKNTGREGWIARSAYTSGGGGLGRGEGRVDASRAYASLWV